MQTEFKIDGVAIKRPSTFKIERYPLTNLVRLSNGDMQGDLIAKKRKFLFTYDAIDSSELDKILDILWESDKLFFQLSYVENNNTKTATVYYGSLPTQLHRTGTKWVWKGVNFSLIEK